MAPQHLTTWIHQKEVSIVSLYTCFKMLFTFANLETTFLRSRGFNASSRLHKPNWLEVTPLADNENETNIFYACIVLSMQE